MHKTVLALELPTLILAIFKKISLKFKLIDYIWSILSLLLLRNDSKLAKHVL